MKSIKAKLIIFFGMLTILICVGLGIISLIDSTKALKSNLEKTLPKIAEQTASNIEGRILGRLSSLESIAAREDIKNPSTSMPNKISILVGEAKRRGSVRMSIIDKDGNLMNTMGTTSNVKDREYFTKALSGVINISDPIVNKGDNTISVVYAVPIRYKNEIVGVLTEAQDGNSLSDLTDRAQFGKTGSAFMINNNGVTIAHKDRNKVLQMDNIIEDAKNDSKLQSLANVQSKMLTEKNGISEYTYDGIDKYVGYSKLQNTNWSIAVVIDKSEILSELDNLKISVVLTSIAFVVIGIGIIYIIANAVSKGIKSTSKHLELLAEGNLCEEVSIKYLKSKDEIGIMTNSMKSMQESLGSMIKKIKENSLSINGQSENLSSISEEIASVSQNVTEAISEVAEGLSQVKVGKNFI
jgi:methyl-accepting chemotaxis protein